MRPIHDETLKCVTNARSRRSFKHYNDFKAIDSSERSHKLVACDRRIVTPRKSQATTKEQKTDKHKGFADNVSDCEKRAVEHEEKILNCDSNGIGVEEELTDRERRIKEIFISHVGACKDIAELFATMATVSDITDVFSVKRHSRSKLSEEDPIELFSDPRGDLFTCRTVYNAWAGERVKDKQIWCNRYDVNNKTMYTIQKRIEEWFPKTCACSFLHHREELENMGMDPDKLHKELIIQSELDLKVLTKSNCKAITFHVENSDKILNWENGKFEKLFANITKTVSAHPKMVVNLKTKISPKIENIISNCLLGNTIADPRGPPHPL